MGILHNYKQILSQNRIAQLLQMHKQALEKRWHLGGMQAMLAIAPYVTTTFFT